MAGQRVLAHSATENFEASWEVIGFGNDSFYTSLSNFELLDLQNPRHLSSIDARLNQNYLVGRTVRTIELGQEEYAYGGTIYEGLLALIPRIL